MFIDDSEELINQKVVVLIRVVFQKSQNLLFETAKEIIFIKFSVTSLINKFSF